MQTVLLVVFVHGRIHGPSIMNEMMPAHQAWMSGLSGFETDSLSPRMGHLTYVYLRWTILEQELVAQASLLGPFGKP